MRDRLRLLKLPRWTRCRWFKGHGSRCCVKTKGDKPARPETCGCQSTSPDWLGERRRRQSGQIMAEYQPGGTFLQWKRHRSTSGRGKYVRLYSRHIQFLCVRHEANDAWQQRRLDKTLSAQTFHFVCAVWDGEVLILWFNMCLIS